MTDFTNGSTNPASNGSSEDKTNFTGQTVKPEGNNNPSQDSGVVLEFNGRKFTKEDLIKKITSADDFIDTLKKEREEDRALLNQVQETLKEQITAKELLNKVKTAGEQQQPAAAVDPSEITKQVLAQLESNKAATQQEQNWAEVTSTLTAAFGDKTNEKVKAVAAENGLSIEEAARLARTNPKVFLKLFPALDKKPMGNNLVGGNSGNILGNKAPADTPKATGFTKARSTKESVSIYLKRFQELSGN